MNLQLAVLADKQARLILWLPGTPGDPTLLWRTFHPEQCREAGEYKMLSSGSRCRSNPLTTTMEMQRLSRRGSAHTGRRKGACFSHCQNHSQNKEGL